MTKKQPCQNKAEDEPVKQHPFFQKEGNSDLINKNFFADPSTSFFKPPVTIQNNTPSNQIQLKSNDKHDFTSKNLTGDPVLEKVYDHERLVKQF